MTHVTLVTGNKTLDVADGESLQRVTAAAIITIPKDIFEQHDGFEVFRDTTSAVSVVGATGVTVNSLGSDISVQCGFAKYVNIGSNTWIGWGDLS